MPKRPIIYRTQFFAKLPGNDTTVVQDTDWNVVETSLGDMVEPRQVNAFGVTGVENVDIFDNAANRIVEVNPDTFYTQYGTAGEQLPRDFNR